MYFRLNSPLGLSDLFKIISTSALHDAEARYPPPRCHPGTREQVLKTLGDWASESKATHTTPIHKNPHVYWLHGSAGAGKSAVMQTLAERSTEDQKLAATFFFWRGDSSRNSPHNLFITVAFQLAMNIPKLAPAINARIVHTPHLLTSSIEIQFKQLILNPCLENFHASSTVKTFLILIDGLDECSNSHDQQRIISILADGVVKNALPFKIVVASRICESFHPTKFGNMCGWMALDQSLNTYNEIQRFLVDKFHQISKDHAASMGHVPQPWPTNEQIQELVQRSSGQFIYVATVLKYIDDDCSVPADRLDFILARTIPHEDDDVEAEFPFAELDALYQQILSTNKNLKQILQILGTILAANTGRGHLSISVFTYILGIPQGVVHSTLSGLHSLFQDPSPIKSHFQLAHASFEDFLLDPRRSRKFFINKEHYHDHLAIHCMRKLKSVDFKICSSIPDTSNHRWMVYLTDSWVYHCQNSTVTPQLVKEFQNLDISAFIPLEYWSKNYTLFTNRAILSLISPAVEFFRGLLSFCEKLNWQVSKAPILIKNTNGPLEGK